MRKMACSILIVFASTLAGAASAEEIVSGAGLCLDVHSACQSENGCNVQVWECNGSKQQTWSAR